MITSKTAYTAVLQVGIHEAPKTPSHIADAHSGNCNAVRDLIWYVCPHHVFLCSGLL